MTSRQAKLLSHSEYLMNRLAAKRGGKRGESQHQGAANLWRYTCPETEKDFYLAEKKTTIKSPYTGKSFTAKPERDTLSEVGKELKENAKAEKAKKASVFGWADDTEV